MGVEGEICNPNGPDFRSMTDAELIRRFDAEIRIDYGAVTAIYDQSAARKEIVWRGHNMVDAIMEHICFDEEDRGIALPDVWSRLIKEIFRMMP